MILIGIIIVLTVIFILTTRYIKPDSPAFAGLFGVLIGSVIGLLASFVSAISGIFSTGMDKEERLKDRVARDALELTRLDYEMRQRALEYAGKSKYFLAPAKVYRELYRALYQLHTTNEWPRTIQDLGLLSIFELGPKDKDDKE